MIHNLMESETYVLLSRCDFKQDTTCIVDMNKKDCEIWQESN